MYVEVPSRHSCSETQANLINDGQQQNSDFRVFAMAIVSVHLNEEECVLTPMVKPLETKEIIYEVYLRYMS